MDYLLPQLLDNPSQEQSEQPESTDQDYDHQSKHVVAESDATPTDIGSDTESTQKNIEETGESAPEAKL
ncbi:hypothetical protein DSO57_1038132 [Entomophthora muscae]|uniref:Uncharacterized protein n=1 Tax=Entomophthora muscae TaxID=34485 RepID=A0ACC2RPS0_9FUNG|nr:hypothetical protein DSO57_1038132 [Entomophthora muscae]